jgi:hypothetical protein
VTPRRRAFEKVKDAFGVLAQPGRYVTARTGRREAAQGGAVGEVGNEGSMQWIGERTVKRGRGDLIFSRFVHGGVAIEEDITAFGDATATS